MGYGFQGQGQFGLYYIFYEWQGPESLAHREEVERFQSLLGSDFRFLWSSYQEVYKPLSHTVGQEHVAYTSYLGKRYFHDAV